MSYDMILFLFKIFKEGVLIIVAQWLARRVFDRKVGAFLRHKVFSTFFLYTQLYKNGLYPVDKARDTKIIQDRPSYEVCKNEM